MEPPTPSPLLPVVVERTEKMLILSEPLRSCKLGPLLYLHLYLFGPLHLPSAHEHDFLSVPLLHCAPPFQDSSVPRE